MIATLIATAVLLQGPPAEDPVLHKDRDLNCAEWAVTANHYLRLGEEKAIAELLDRSGPKPTLFAISPKHASHILRLLYDPKPGKTLRRPLLGDWDGLGRAIEAEPWPEFPFVIHAGVIFQLVDSYMVMGEAETPKSYADYLKENGVFRTQQYAAPSSKKAKEALDLLVRSSRWRRAFGDSTQEAARLRRQTEYLP